MPVTTRLIRQARGVGLLEVLVAIPLLALLGTLAVRLLLGVHQRALADDGALGAVRELRHGTAVLFAELRGVRDGDVIAWSDSTIEIDVTVAAGIVCNADLNGQWIATLGTAHGGTSSSAPSFDATIGGDIDAMWNAPPQSGDRIDWWEAGPAPDDSLRANTDVVANVSVTNDCATSPLTAAASAANTTRLQLATPRASRRSVGAPLRLLRRARYSHYRASDGKWYIGRRTMGPAGWDIVQPVAGPVDSRASGGFHLVVFDSLGSPIAPGGASPVRRVRLAVSAPRESGRASPLRSSSDSISVDLALRADREDDA
ncbi:MAG: hypothetical protein KA154_02875 [Gemmatimonadaceae bacterium]|nr:hypothetical protein [Gemmatimonadaceae bacterium]